MFRVCLLVLATLFVSLEAQNIDGRMKGVKGVIFDMDGVLRCKDDAIPGASSLIYWMKEKGIAGVILTNECRFTPEKIRNDLWEMGIPYPEFWPIYTAAFAARDFFVEHYHGKGETFILPIGEEGLFSALEEIESQHITVSKEVPCRTDDYNHLFVVLGSVNQIEINDLQKAATLIKQGAKVITTCPDMCDPASKGDQLLGMPNHMLHMIKMRAAAIPYSVGKPNPMVLNKAIALLQEQNSALSKEEMIFVGDSLDTDICIAFENGISSVLVLSGNTQSLEESMHVLEPDFVVPSVESLLSSFIQADIQSKAPEEMGNMARLR